MSRGRIGLMICVILMALLAAQAAFASVVCQQGDTGEEVRVVQTRLYTLGYQPSAPEAPYKYTASTKTHVRKFQLASGLDTTGIVDNKTYNELTSSQAIAYQDYLDRIHAPGGSGVEIKAAEAQLKKLGYFGGKPNNNYDESTARSVRMFQDAHGLKESGNADKATRKRLFSDNAITAAQYREKNNLTTLKRGSKGDQVSLVQQQLARLGYYTGKISGSFDAATELALKMFQAANDIKVTGIAGDETRYLLNAGGGVTYAQYLKEQSAVELSLGDKGMSVILLQNRLTELAFYSGSINGNFDVNVQTAVKRFQNANHVNERSKHGVATRATRAAMNSADAINRYDSEGLMKGDDLPAVRKMTEALRDLGFLSGTSSLFTTTVQTGVKLFQQANKLKITGIATPETLSVLYSGNAVSYDEFHDGSGNEKIEKVINLGMKLLGRPYHSPCNAPTNFDCSGFVRYIMAKGAGISLPGEVVSQARQCAQHGYTKITEMGSLKRGDLLYFDTQSSKPIGHAAIYLGKSNGKPKFLHASSSAGKVVVTEFHEWYQKRFLFGFRWAK